MAIIIAMRQSNSPDISYTNLLKQIKQEIFQGLINARLAYEHEKIIAYWKIGESIAKHLSSNVTETDYGKQLYKNLSGDLGIGERLLYQMSQFYSAYPNFEPVRNITWSHYRILTTIKDEKQRKIIEAKIAKDNLSKRALEVFLKEDRIPSPTPHPIKPSKKLSISKGKLYTYEIFKAAYADNLLIDCGFNVYHESEVVSFKDSFVESVKTESGYKLIESSAKAKDLYTYKAYVEKIIDGDTIWLNVDCGFKIWSRQKIRLRGINAPEVTTPKGIEAMKFVIATLKGLPFVIVKSHGRDKYDRYLADILYLKGEDNPQTVLENGVFLNQRLLDEDLAVYVQ
jgi:endonuclease YncB( thermonuclease family)